ncbi:ABC-three component system protein [Azospirillum brasilense]|uniref:ABC-three component system protein n=1 Tax=Azospirillum brasilense TaxID=192 RepID=UPI00131E63FF|nr:ABC-three component system protein [Azospirillum brasilense]MDW7628998.1 ABC-three component system protein [Azospirillum brasilense]
MVAHTAADSASGYLYQCRYALFAALERSAREPGLMVRVEVFDDVSFDVDGTPRELIQTKHSRKASPMTDLSPQVWNTIGIWTKRVIDHPEELGRTALTLVSTASVPNESGLAFLRPPGMGRDADKAHGFLLQAAATSKNKDVAWATTLFLDQGPEVQLQILEMITVLDASPNIVDVADRIRERLRYTTRDNLGALIERLEGWWFNRLAGSLKTGKGATVAVTDIDAKVHSLQESFQPTRLPIDHATELPMGEVTAKLERRPFVEQLRLIAIGPTGIEAAVIDYFRAGRQRSRWMREHLLDREELSNFRDKLLERWRRKWGIVESKLVRKPSEDEMIGLGQDLYEKICDECVPIREVSEPFLTQGSYHILADNGKIGWHPTYKKKMQEARRTAKDDTDAALG